MAEPLVVFIQLMASGILSFFSSIILSKYLIKNFIRFKSGQPIRREGVESHYVKQGTPTVGGFAFTIATLIGFFAFNHHFDIQTVGVLFTYISFFLIGLGDDLIKLRFKRSAGISGYIRLVLEISTVIYGIYHFDLLPSGAWNLSFFSFFHAWYVGVWYIPFALFVIIGTANAVNITDGLDGLAAGMTVIILAPLALMALKKDLIPLTFLLICQMGSLMGFLRWNFHPAQIFMGDTGSLALGGLLGIVTIVLQSELILLIAGFLFVLETLSVIAQVTSFQLFKKRLFAMAPWHHHLELKGWPEWKIIMFFWLVTTGLSTIALIMGGF